jgi:DNA-binding NtrC family response regulator
MKPPTRILLVDDDDAFRKVLAAEIADFGYEVSAAASGEEALRQFPKLDPDVVVLDLRLPGMTGLDVLKHLREQSASAEVIMLTGHGSIDTAIESIRMGAFDYVVKPCSLDELNIRIQRAIERKSLRHRANLLERGLTPPDLSSSFIGNSARFRALMHLIERVAPSDSTVLVTGETGVGKERVAKLIHARSLRSRHPFVVVECAALQESLLLSELFGHERGAFTGAERAKPGLFEVAGGGTIFLDEIGEVSPATQTKLLRVLDTATFRRVGGTGEVHVDVRVLAATNRDLTSMVRQGLFREDLYYRLNTICIEIPPLRERGEDIELLAKHFVANLNERFESARALSPQAMQRLLRHNWPGNVRELRHVIEAAMVVCEGTEILPEHLPAPLRGELPSAPAGNGNGPLTLQQLERKHISLALQSTSGNRGKAAKLLGISERNLYRKLRDYDLLP